MFRLLLLILLCVPIVEVWVLIRIGRVLGLGPTIALLLLTGIIGAALARRQGFRVLGRIQECTARGETPALALLEGVLVFLAGVLLVIPGVISDCLGFLLLLPPARAWAARRLADAFGARVLIAGRGGNVSFRSEARRSTPPSPVAGEIIDAEYREVTGEKARRLQPPGDGRHNRAD
jgi:UPF0716 protein FxsA